LDNAKRTVKLYKQFIVWELFGWTKAIIDRKNPPKTRKKIISV